MNPLTWRQELLRTPLSLPQGTIIKVNGLICEIAGIRAAIGDSLEVENNRKTRLEVVGFQSDRVLATPLGPVTGMRPGTKVQIKEPGGGIQVGEELLGRVVDPFGRPLDGLQIPIGSSRRPLEAESPDPFSRRPIESAFSTSVRAIDGLLPLGIGQRVGIFAGSGVGKSTLLGMICRGSEADVNVIALIGERGRELNAFIRETLGAEGLAKSVVVAATSDQAPLLRARGAEAATAIAEEFRAQGKNVLLVMDSVTRYAMALREVSLAAGEPPATKGYPPSVFAALPRLLERTGTAEGKGVITALYTVLVEGDDLNDPISDTVRGILDGHIVLSRHLAEKGHFPAIDVGKSVSRLAPQIASPEHLAATHSARNVLTTVENTQDLIQVGAYAPGNDHHVDTCLQVHPQLET
ncbi:MAG: FliI/YscN family ATPase, partial [Polyangiaceae bacterium]|nr:FliI/YscN family ATPase [Polyangiaceae bacterium]